VNAPDSPPPAARPVGLFCGLAVVDVIQLVEAPPAPDDKIVALDQIIAAGGPATNAAVAFAHDADAIGIDAEPDEPLPDGVIDIVASPAERRRLRALPVRGVSWDRLLFSAKESVYKAWYPRERSWLGFEDADVALGDGVLTAEIHGESGLRFTLTGYWGVSDGILVTAVVVPAGKWPAGT